MKKLLVGILVAFIAIPVFSQINLGIKVAAATTTVPTYNLATGANTIAALKNASWGFQGGLFLRLSLLGIYLQPEVLFATNTYDYNVTLGTSPAVAMKQTFSKLDVPVLVGIKLGPLRINAGPDANIPIGSPKALIDDPNFKDLYKGATFGYQVGAGFDLLKKLTFDVRYEGSLSKKFGDAISVGGQSFKLDSRQPSFILSVGLMF
jgi:hypothetical protein